MTRVFIPAIVLTIFFYQVSSAFETASRNKAMLRMECNTSTDVYAEIEAVHFFDRLADLSLTTGTTVKFGRFFNAVSIETDIEYMQVVKYSGGAFVRSERRPRLAPSLMLNLSGYRIACRHRMELRIRESGVTVRHRPRAKITAPWKYTSLRLSPYLSDELFFPERRFASQEIEAGMTGRYRNFEFALGDMIVLERPLFPAGNVLILEIKYRFAAPFAG